MDRFVCIICAVSIVLALSVGCFAAEPQLSRPGAFTRYETSTPNDLAYYISVDPMVAERYTSHFGVSKEELVDYFKNYVQVVAIKSPVPVTTYFVSKSGRILSKQRTLTVGRRIFVGPGNAPIAEQGCGNPLTKRLPAKPETTTEVKPLIEEIGQPPEVVTPPVVEADPVVEPEVVAVLPAVETITIPPVATMSPAPSIWQFLGAAAPLAAGLQLVQASNETVVPEPGTLGAIALGAVGIASGFIRSDRRSRRK